MYPLARLRSAVFLLNSRMGPFTVPPRGGPLLPKLRGYFAEFLNEVSLARLGMSVPSHLCRFRYGRRVNTHGLFWEAETHGLATGKPAARSGGSPPYMG